MLEFIGTSSETLIVCCVDAQPATDIKANEAKTKLFFIKKHLKTINNTNNVYQKSLQTRVFGILL